MAQRHRATADRHGSPAAAYEASIALIEIETPNGRLSAPGGRLQAFLAAVGAGCADLGAIVETKLRSGTIRYFWPERDWPRNGPDGADQRPTHRPGVRTVPRDRRVPQANRGLCS